MLTIPTELAIGYAGYAGYCGYAATVATVATVAALAGLAKLAILVYLRYRVEIVKGWLWPVPVRSAGKFRPASLTISTRLRFTPTLLPDGQLRQGILHDSGEATEACFYYQENRKVS